MKKLLLTLMLFSILLAGVVSNADAESAKSRIEKFKKTFRFNPQAAFNALKPLDTPALVDFAIQVYTEAQTFNYYIQAAAEETLRTTIDGKPLERLHGHMFKHDKAYMRAKLARVVGGMKNEDSQKALLHLLKREAESEVQVSIIEALTNFPDKNSIKAILKFTGTTYRPEVRLTSVEALGAMKALSVVSKIAKMAKRDKVEIRCSAIWALGEIGGDVAQKTVEDLLSDSSASIRASACNAAAHFKDKGTFKRLTALLTDSEWQVISAAVIALRKRNEIDAVVPLINAMQKVEGKLIEVFQEALEAITGYKFGTDPENWKDWLEESGGKITRNPTPRTNEIPYVTYHKIKTHSKDMLFLVDISGSMLEKADAAAAKYLGEGAEVKGDTRLDFVKAELIRTIKSLPATAKFDIITFAEEATLWRGAQTPADEKGKKAAVGFIERLKANGGTNLYGALTLAYGKLKQDTANYPHDRNPDTIFLLSDGMPTLGDVINPHDIISIVTRLNRVRQITINTIGVGKDASPLLKPLAEKNFGEFVLIAK